MRLKSGILKRNNYYWGKGSVEMKKGNKRVLQSVKVRDIHAFAYLKNIDCIFSYLFY